MLTPGTRLGPYEIASPLGAGGMGEVYRARDTRLGRDVAIKVLPPDVARDANRRARFEREARAVAALSHPNILALHDIGTEDDTLYVVTELLEGETLADRLRQGALPVRKAVEIAVAVARGLGAAHEKGIAHRDLKPANVFLLADGQVKILDFGLAKLQDSRTPGPQDLQTSRPQDPEDPSASPTLTSPDLTARGIILGTAGYMAPEQIRGQPVDGRADLFALGAVLYEMLTGTRAFVRESTIDTLNAILKEDPPDLATIRADLPPALTRIVAHALEKNPAERFQTARDVVFALDTLIGGASAVTRQGSSRPLTTRWPMRAFIVAAAVIASAVWLSVRLAPRPAATAERVIHTSLPLPAEAPMSVRNIYPSACLAISPDSLRVVYCSEAPGASLYQRALDRPAVAPIPGTDGGRQPFFSPDGVWLGFFTDAGELRKVPIGGGAPVTLARGLSYAAFVNASWPVPDRIVFDTWNGGLRVIGADGGAVAVLTSPTDEWHQFPQPLPGRRVLYTVLTPAGPRVEARSIDGGAATIVATNAAHARYLAPDHLLFIRDRAVTVAPFDPATLRLVGDAATTDLKPMVDNANAAAPLPQLDVARDGMLVFAPAPPGAEARSLVLADRGARRTVDVVRLPDDTVMFSVSPDGQRVAVTAREGAHARVSVVDLPSLTTTRVADQVQDLPTRPQWAADGRRLFVGTFTTNEAEVLAYDLDGGGVPAPIHAQPGTYIALDGVSRDGSTLVFTITTDVDRSADIWAIDLRPTPPRAHAFLATPAREFGASLAPDRPWIAYISEESGAPEAYLQRFPAGGSKMRVSGGVGPVLGVEWSPDGRELLTHAADGSLHAIPVAWQPDPLIGKPALVARGSFVLSGDGGRTFSVHPDGRRVYLVRQPPEANRSGHISIVQNWLLEVRRLTSASRP